MPRHDAIPYPVESIREWIAEGWTQQRIADHLSKTLDPRVTAKLVYKVCKKHGIQCQRTGPRSGEGHPEWKGGLIVNGDGYVMRYCPDHPNRRTHSPYILEHRLVMEEILGRNLTKSEVVHHIDGDKQNNAPSNLELFSTNGEHLKATLKGCVPQWTPAGKRAMREAAQAKRQRAARLRDAIQTALGLDAPPSNRTASRYLKKHGLSWRKAYGMADRNEPLPADRTENPTPRRGKVRRSY